MKIYTEQQIHSMENLFNLQEQDTILYQMSPEEIEWYWFIKGKYSIAEYIENNTTGSFLLTIDVYEMSKCLDYDCRGAGKAVMLSDDSALQRIFFWTYIGE